MSTEQAAAPKPVTTGGDPDRPRASRRKWAPPPPSQRKFGIWIVLGLAAVLGLGLVTALHYVFRPRQHAPALATEFRDTTNYFAIQAPRNWSIDDRVQEGSVFIQGPREQGFRPLIWIASLPSPGKLPKFAAEHKARMKLEEPSVNFTFEDSDSIDGCEAVRLEYDSDYSEAPGAPGFKLKTLQFVLKDPTYYVFYKLTCSSRADTFEEHKAAFEASAHTFHRLPLPESKPRFLPQ